MVEKQVGELQERTYRCKRCHQVVKRTLEQMKGNSITQGKLPAYLVCGKCLSEKPSVLSRMWATDLDLFTNGVNGDINKWWKRFWGKVSVKGPDECWEWKAGRFKDGYGGVCLHHGKMLRVHRVSWMFYNGPIPKGMLVLHHCDNPICVNPDHLFLGTDADNVADMDKKGRRRNNPCKGEKNGNAKLDEDEIVAIVQSKDSVEELSRKYAISTHHVRQIRQRKSWKHMGPMHFYGLGERFKKPSFERVSEISYAGCKRFLVRCLVHGPITERELALIAKKEVEKIIATQKVNAIAVGFWRSRSEAMRKPAVAMIEWAPGGVWVDADRVKAGDYSKHAFKIEHNHYAEKEK